MPLPPPHIREQWSSPCLSCVFQNQVAPILRLSNKIQNSALGAEFQGRPLLSPPASWFSVKGTPALAFWNLVQGKYQSHTSLSRISSVHTASVALPERALLPDLKKKKKTWLAYFNMLIISICKCFLAFLAFFFFGSNLNPNNSSKWARVRGWGKDYSQKPRCIKIERNLSMAIYGCGDHTLIRISILSIFKDNDFKWTCFLSYEERCPAYLNQESLS